MKKLTKDIYEKLIVKCLYIKYYLGLFLLLKIRKSGFISIECIISIAILYVAVYLVSTSLYNCYSFISRNISDREMLSTAKNI